MILLDGIPGSGMAQLAMGPKRVVHDTRVGGIHTARHCKSAHTPTVATVGNLTSLWLVAALLHQAWGRRRSLTETLGVQRQESRTLRATTRRSAGPNQGQAKAIIVGCVGHAMRCQY